MAIDPLTAITPNDGSSYPDNAAINATSPSATDGTPLTAIGMNNYWHGRQQALLNYAGLTPTGVVESDTVSQELEAIQKGFGVGVGKYVQWGIKDDPSVTGDRVLLLSGQGVLRASYTPLDTKVYVGDGDNPTAPYFYHADDAAGTIRNIAGVYLILPLPDESRETMFFKDVKAATTNGGDFNSGAWQTRVLNTSEGDIKGASLGSNQMTLPAGKYIIRAYASAFQVNNHKAKLYNITDTADEIIGSASDAPIGAAVVVNSIITGQFTITAEKVFEIQHQCATTKASTGFGLPADFSVSEIYTQVEISRIDSIPQGITY